MKYLILIATVICLAVCTAGAEHYFNSINSYTGAAKSSQIIVPASTRGTMIFQTSASGCSVFRNQTSGQVGFPVNANALTSANIPGSVSQLVFKCTSTAATKATIYVSQ